jgi:hypothetical protein
MIAVIYGKFSKFKSAAVKIENVNKMAHIHSKKQTQIR